MTEITRKIIEVTTKMINEEIDLLDGCRTLVYLQHGLREPPDVFLVLRGIDSETDIFPISKTEKQQWNPEALSRLEKEKNEYISLVKDEMLEACRRIIVTLRAIADLT